MIVTLVVLAVVTLDAQRHAKILVRLHAELLAQQDAHHALVAVHHVQADAVVDVLVAQAALTAVDQDALLVVLHVLEVVEEVVLDVADVLEDVEDVLAVGQDVLVDVLVVLDVLDHVVHTVVDAPVGAVELVKAAVLDAEQYVAVLAAIALVMLLAEVAVDAWDVLQDVMVVRGTVPLVQEFVVEAVLDVLDAERHARMVVRVVVHAQGVKEVVTMDVLLVLVDVEEAVQEGVLVHVPEHVVTIVTQDALIVRVDAELHAKGLVVQRAPETVVVLAQQLVQPLVVDVLVAQLVVLLLQKQYRKETNDIQKSRIQKTVPRYFWDVLSRVGSTIS